MLIRNSVCQLIPSLEKCMWIELYILWPKLEGTTQIQIKLEHATKNSDII